MKKLKLLFINILLLAIVFLFADYSVFSAYKEKYGFDATYFQNMTKKISISDEYDKASIQDFSYRSALNEEKNSEKSIVFTGCSFVYGVGLEENQTLPYKVAQLINVPIYNLGFVSRAINTTYSAVKLGIFDEKVKIPPKTVSYNYADFHLLRIVMPNVFFEGNEYLYNLKGETLVKKRPPFIVSRFPLLCVVREQLHNYLIQNSKNYRNYVKKLLKAYFVETKKLLNSKYGDFKFIIMVYQNSPIFEEIASEMEKEGFVIIRVFDDFGIDTNNDEYVLPDGHPNEKAWDEIVPQLVPYL